MYESKKHDLMFEASGASRKRRLARDDTPDSQPLVKRHVVDRFTALKAEFRNKRSGRFTESFSRDSSHCQSRSNSRRRPSSGDLGYHSQAACCYSVRSCWQDAARKRRGLCRCQRHSDSGLVTKSAQNRSLRRRDRRRLKTACRSKVMIDEEGHLVYEEGDVLIDRYKIGRTLGRGTFGKVVECRDLTCNRRVAMKIVRKGCQDYESAMMEVRVLEELRPRDSHERGFCIEMLDWFDYHGHICIVFEMLGHSIYEFLRRNAYRPFPIEQIQHIAYQLCRAVLYCHEHGLTHTDLKPENILFIDSSFEFTGVPSSSRKNGMERRVKLTDVRLIDFGSAIFDYERHGSVISTRQYRAPEVILDLGWSYEADVWSIGCILVELYTGQTLFQTHGSIEHLAMMERVLGPIPTRMSTQCPIKRYFRNGRLLWNRSSRDARIIDQKCHPLESYMMSKSSLHTQLFDLVKLMLRYEPSQRIGLRAALHHPFFDGV